MTRTVTVYRDTDPSAPVLTGTAGDMITLLDAVLVNGYGAKPAAGWTKAFSGTNKAAYRNDTTDGTGTYYRVQDDLTGTNQRYAYLNMYESMSDVDTGTNGYPSTQTRGGFQKSNTQDSTARPWVIIADNCAAHILIKHGANGTEWEYFFIGDIFSYLSADAYRGAVIMRSNNSTALTSMAYTANTAPRNQPLGSTGTTNAIIRSQAGTGLCINFGMHTDAAKMNTSFSSAQNGYFGSTACNALSYPNAINNGLFLAPIWVHHGSSPQIVRGYMPGLWAPMHSRPLADGDTFSGVSGQLAGKTFEAFNVYNAAQLLIETSNTWE